MDNRHMDKRKALSVFLGALYGLVFRLFAEREDFDSYISVDSVTFLTIVPIVIGIIPVLLLRPARSLMLMNFCLPLLSVMLFFLVAFSSGLEDIVCLLILGFPYFLIAGLTGLLTGAIARYLHNRKTMLVLLLPFATGPIEKKLPSPSGQYTVWSEVVIHQPDSVVWSAILSVPELTEHEFNEGFFNRIGVPRPVRSVLYDSCGRLYRKGYFTDGLMFNEAVDIVEPLRHARFLIDLKSSHLRNKPLDKHILRNSSFRFGAISYRILPLSAGSVRLQLECEYELSTKMNAYADFWASRVIRDFEERLLQAIRAKLLH